MNEKDDRAFEAIIVECMRCGDADPDSLPELTDKERAALDSLGPDFVQRILDSV